MSEYLNLPTLMLLASLINTLNIVFITLAWLRSRENCALNWWTLAVWSAAIAAGLASLSQFHKGFLIQAGAPALYVTAVAFGWQGYTAFFRGRAAPWWIALIGAVMTIAAYLSIGEPVRRAQVVLTLLFVGAASYLMAAAWVIYRGTPGESLPSSRYGALLFVTHAVTHMAPIPLAYLWPVRMDDAKPESVWLFIVILLLLLHTIGTSFMTAILIKERAEQRLLKLANTDMLTGIMNRRAFVESVESQLAQQGTRGVLVIADLDQFKTVNDTYGHLAGDAVLKVFADSMQEIAGETALLGRLGGEEFALYFGGVSGDEGRAAAEAIRQRLEARLVMHQGAAVRATASFGVAERWADGLTFSQMTAAADRALYLAKAEGRNRVCVSATGLKALADALAANAPADDAATEPLRVSV